jgi:hypothetical protein
VWRGGESFKAGGDGFWCYVAGHNVRYKPGDPIEPAYVHELVVVRNLTHLPIEVSPGE